MINILVFYLTGDFSNALLFIGTMVIQHLLQSSVITIVTINVLVKQTFQVINTL